MSSYNGVCAEQHALLKQERGWGGILPLGPVEKEGTVPRDQSFVPPFLGRQMTSCLYFPHPIPERLEEISQTPAEEQKAMQRQWKAVQRVSKLKLL